MTVQNPSDQAPPLRIFGGEAPPASVATDLAALLSLPVGARTNFAEVLVPCLEPKLADDTDRMIEAFCRKHEAVGNRVALATRGSRFVLWEAARSNATAEELARDLDAILPGEPGALAALLVPIYDASRDRIRGELVRRSVGDHGAVVTGVDWRLDRVLSSQHARSVDVTVAVLTFAYREGEEKKRLTLQFDREALARLKASCERLLK